MCGDPADHYHYQVAVLDEPEGRGGSREIHESVTVGTTLQVDGPRNRFKLVDAPRYLFIAGGIGITPILPMIREVDSRGSAWRLVYGGRALRSMAFIDDLAAYPPDRVTIVPEDAGGRPDLVAAISSATEGTAVYACGPPGLLQAVATFCGRQLSADALHVERFVADAPAEGAAATAYTPIEVELRRSGHVLQMGPGQTILSAIQEVLPSMTCSCEEGICGSCETRVLGGVPLHRDSVLSAEERDSNKTMMVCVGWSRTQHLVLDL